MDGVQIRANNETGILTFSCLCTSSHLPRLVWSFVAGNAADVQSTQVCPCGSTSTAYYSPGASGRAVSLRDLEAT